MWPQNMQNVFGVTGITDMSRDAKSRGVESGLDPGAGALMLLLQDQGEGGTSITETAR